MLLITCAAPAARALRVAAPLCSGTSVWPSQVPTPFSTRNLKPSAPILDLASLVRIVVEICESLGCADAAGCAGVLAAKTVEVAGSKAIRKPVSRAQAASRDTGQKKCPAGLAAASEQVVSEFLRRLNEKRRMISPRGRKPMEEVA